MGRRVSAAELEERLKVTRERDRLRADRRVANPKPYKPQGQKTTIYYRDVLDGETIIKIPVSAETLQEIGNVADFGILLEPPANSIPVPVRGLQKPILKIYWYYGDATPAEVITPWKSRWVKFYDKRGEQSHRSIPFCSSGGSEKLDDLIALFSTMFVKSGNTEPSKRALLGPNGQAELRLGKQVLVRGNRRG